MGPGQAFSHPISKAARLAGLLRGEEVVRLVGVNDGFSATLAERNGFEGLWASGLAISAAHGVPDASIATMTEFFQAAQVIERATDLPVVADCDTGFGDVNVLAHMVNVYARAGIAAICIEDKLFPKRNSFTDGQLLEDMHAFAAKIDCAIEARGSAETMVLARIESFIAGAGVADAVRRARLYEEAGADGLVIHSRHPRPDEIESFAHEWQRHGSDLPVIVIPTTYPSVTVAELRALGVDAVIYANQILRAAMQAMDQTLQRIALDGTSAGIDEEIASVDDLLELMGTGEVGRRDAWFQRETERRRAAELPREVSLG